MCESSPLQEWRAFAGSSNYSTRCSNGRDSRRGVTSGREKGWRWNSFHPLLGAIEASAMLGSHRERNPSRSENWHRRTTIYILLPRRVISSSSSHPSRIPRNSAAGDWRWRPRALRDKPHQHTGAHQRQPTPTNIPRHRRSPETFGDTGEKVIG